MRDSITRKELAAALAKMYIGLMDAPGVADQLFNIAETFQIKANEQFAQELRALAKEKAEYSYGHGDDTADQLMWAAWEEMNK